MSKVIVLVVKKSDFVLNCDFHANIELLEFSQECNLSLYDLAFIDVDLVKERKVQELKIPSYYFGKNKTNFTTKGDLSFGFILIDNLIEEVNNICKLYFYLNSHYSDLDVEKLLQNQIEVYQQIKNIHKKIVPTREYLHKGFKLFSKYMVGRSNGGEYYIVDSNKEHLYIFQSTSNSYLINSLLISFSESMSSYLNGKEYIKHFVEYLEKHLNSDQDVQSIEFLWLKIDSSSLKVEGYQLGQGRLYLNRMEVDLSSTDYLSVDTQEKMYFSFQLSRNDQMIWLSSGCLNVINNLRLPFDIDNFLSIKRENAAAFFEDFFFELSNKGEEEFLSDDSICLLCEVGANVIHQI